MNFIVNLVAKWSGANAVWAAADGKKVYIAAFLGLLSGLAGVGAEVYAPIAAHDAAGLFAVIRSLPTDSAWLLLVSSLAGLGVVHRVDKAAAPAVPPAA